MDKYLARKNKMVSFQLRSQIISYLAYTEVYNKIVSSKIILKTHRCCFSQQSSLVYL